MIAHSVAGQDNSHPWTTSHGSAASPCLGSVDVIPWWARVDFSDCHYIPVFSTTGGAGGFSSVSFRAFRTRRASGQPPLTPRRSP